MKTIRRDWLKRQIEKGVVEAKVNYALTDDYAYDNSVNNQRTKVWKPAVVCEHSKRTYDRPVVYFADFDFKTSTGYAGWEEDGTITFCPLSSEYYTLRIIAP